MPECIALLHNSQLLIEVLKKVFERVYPEAKLVNILDESLLRDIREKGRVDHLGVRRVCRYALCAEDLGADAVLMTCSSLCEAVFAARPLVKIPAFAINEPMAKEAVAAGSTITVLGTLRSVLAPTARLIAAKAEEAGKKVKVEEALSASAFEALVSGDPRKHDELVLNEVVKAAKGSDVIVFAQGSMSRLVPEARAKASIPILECLDSGVKQVRDHFQR